MTHPTDEELDRLVKLTEEFVTATWHLLDNSEMSGPKDDPIVTVWQPDFDDVSALLDRCEGLPSGSTEHMAAGELLAANMTAAITTLRAQLAEAALTAQPSPDVAELVKALEFYADRDNYEPVYERMPCDCCTEIYEPVKRDEGDIARAALARVKGGE